MLYPAWVPLPLRQSRFKRTHSLPIILFSLILFLLYRQHRPSSQIRRTAPWDHYVEEEASDRKVQVFIPIDKKKAHNGPDFCRDLWSAIASGYRVTLYNWELDKARALETHKPKIDALARILTTPTLLAGLNVTSTDMIFLIDGIDVILQLPPSTLKERYDRLPHDVYAAGSFNCWPNSYKSEACKGVAPSRLPEDLFWDDGMFALMKQSMSRLPIHVNSGLILGSLGGMASLFQKLAVTAHAPDYRWEYDQAAFNIHLSKGDLWADNDYSLFWCAEHVYSSLTVLPHSYIPHAGTTPPHHPHMHTRSLPDRPMTIDRRTGVIPIALHFNGLEPKKGYNDIWEDMYHHPLAEAAKARKTKKEVEWIRKRTVGIVLDAGVEVVSVDEVCGEQLGLR